MKHNFLKLTRLFVKEKGGRNNQGRITVRARGGGHKKQSKFTSLFPRDLKGFVESIEYSSSHSAFLAKIFDLQTRMHFFVVAATSLKVGSFIQGGYGARFFVGNFLPLEKAPLGSTVFSLFCNNKKFRLALAGGCFLRVLKKGSFFSKIQLPSGEERLVSSNSIVCVGRVSNLQNNKVNLQKAGRKRWLSRRPIVRGTVKNPVDHPHGGGEGKGFGKKFAVSPWSRLAHGGSTSRSKNPLILKRRL